MKSKLFATVAAVSMTAALSLATAGQAVARPNAPAKASPQVNGVRLQGALLPTSAFGDTFNVKASLNTGRNLATTRVQVQVSRLSCGTFENSAATSGFGDTAGATQEVDNSNPWPQYPESIFGAYQTVLQFANSSAAASFFGKAHAKYAACTSWSVPSGSASLVPGGGNLDVNLDSLAYTSVGHARAFAAVETVAFSDKPGLTFYLTVLYAVSGTNVYEIWQLGGNTDQTTLMPTLISRVQALYSHR